MTLDVVYTKKSSRFSGHKYVTITEQSIQYSSVMVKHVWPEKSELVFDSGKWRQLNKIFVD